MIVLAGGLAEAGDVFVEQVTQSFAKYAWTKFPNPVRGHLIHMKRSSPLVLMSGALFLLLCRSK